MKKVFLTLERSHLLPVLGCPYFIFSSHEHFVPKVSYWDQSMSVVHLQQFHLNDNSYTTGSILTKLHRYVPKVTLNKNGNKKFDPSKNMATTPA